MSERRNHTLCQIAAVLLASITIANSMSAGEDALPAAIGMSGAVQPVYQEEWNTEFRERRYRVARPVWETNEQEKRTKVLRPVWQTQWREETYVVRKPVIETAMREEQYTLFEPVTSCVPQTVDQGQWVEQQVITPRRPAKRLKWIPGGWTVDPQTGTNYWKPPMLRPALVERPSKVTAQRIWQPNLTVIQNPTTTMMPRVHVRKVPVQQVRYVEERCVRKTPQRVCRMVEQEVVCRIPVTVCRTVYEDRVERVPVRVRRCVPSAPIDRPCDGAAPMLPVPVPSPMPPTSRPQLDPHLPVPDPTVPVITPGLENEPRTSSDEPPMEPVDPATVALHRNQSVR